MNYSIIDVFEEWAFNIAFPGPMAVITYFLVVSSDPEQYWWIGLGTVTIWWTSPKSVTFAHAERSPLQEIKLNNIKSIRILTMILGFNI